MIIMYIFNDSKKFKLVCVKYDNCIEFKASRNGNVIDGILSQGIYYNWIAFPSLNVSCELADLSDSFGMRNSFPIFSTMILMYQLFL